MKNKLCFLQLTLAASFWLPAAARAQGTYLSAPDGNPTNALIVANGGNIGIGTSEPTRGRLSIANLPDNTFGISTHSDRDGRGIEILAEDFEYGSSGSALSIGLGSGSGSTFSEFQAHTAGKTLPGSLVLQRGGGNVGIGTTTPQAKLDVNGKINCTVLELTSDRNQKQDFAAVDARRVLDRLVGLPIQTWAYTNDAQVRHLGPMAQDWKAAYPELGSDDKHIAAGDLASVALAAIQGLNAKLTESLQAKDAEIAALKRELVSVKESVTDRLAVLEKAMSKSAVQQASFRPEAAR